MATDVGDEVAFGGLIKVASGDVMDALNAANQQNTTRAYRTVIRAIFSGAEAVVWYAKDLTASVVKADPGNYSPFEMAALRDATYTVATNGKVSPKANFIPLTTSIKLVTRLLSRSQVSNADFDLGKDAMVTIKRALAVRHRLTHPKTAADMDVSEEDIGAAVATWTMVLTFALNVALEADKRLGTGMFPLKKSLEAGDYQPRRRTGHAKRMS